MENVAARAHSGKSVPSTPFLTHAPDRAKDALWLLHPEHHVTVDGACSCRLGSQCPSKGKHTCLRTGYQRRATLDLLQIAKWQVQFPTANIGGVIPAGYIEVDIDHHRPDQNGTATLAQLEEAHEKLPATVTTRSPRGSRRLYRTPAGYQFAKQTYSLGDGLELLTAGHNVVLPGSVTERGTYSYAEGLSPAAIAVAPAPDWLLASALASQQQQEPSSPSAQPQRHTPRLDASRLTDRSHYTEGSRNIAITRLAGQLRASGIDDRDTLTASLLTANDMQCNPPLPEAEVRKIAGSIAKRTPSAGARAHASRHHCETLLGEVAATDWKGLAGLSRLAVLVSVLLLCQRLGKVTLKISIRHIALLAGVSDMTAARTVFWLCRTGWIIRCKRGVGNEPNTYRISRKAAVISGTQEEPRKGASDHRLYHSCMWAHDLFRHRGLGKSGALITAAIRTGSTVTAAIVTRTGLRPATVQRRLKKGEKIGYFTHDSDGWHMGEIDEDKASRRLGTFGRGHRQHLLHQNQREQFALRAVWLKERAERLRRARAGMPKSVSEKDVPPTIWLDEDLAA